jgi:hypothetical protein
LLTFQPYFFHRKIKYFTFTIKEVFVTMKTNPIEIAAIVVWKVVDMGGIALSSHQEVIAQAMLRRQQASAVVA